MKASMSPGCDRLELTAETPVESSILELIRRKYSSVPDPAWPGPKPNGQQEWQRWCQEQKRCGRDLTALGRIINL